MSREFHALYNAVIPQQARRLEKLLTERFFVMSVPPPVADFPLQFEVSGSRAGSYTVSLHADGGLWCTCPDMRSHCQKHRCLCKHLCFLFVRVLKTHAREPYDLARCPAELLEVMRRKIAGGGRGLQVDAALRSACVRFDKYREPAKDDDCAICYDSLSSPAALTPEEAKLVGCPECLNAFHEACARRWLSHAPQPSCVICRSQTWSSFTS